MALPESWVNELFGRLTTRYGKAFYAQWHDLHVDAIKADWAKALDGVSARSLARALDWLPLHPPNASQFRRLCEEAREALPVTHQLEDRSHVPADPERVKAIVAGLVQKWGHDEWSKLTPNQQMMANIRRIVASRGGRMTAAQRDAMKACERYEATGQPQWME